MQSTVLRCFCHFFKQQDGHVKGDQNLNIAICDDEQRYITKVKEDLIALQSYENEFTFFEFKTGRELILDFTAGKYAVIILDIQMKGLNGVETARFLRDIDEKVIIIFLTSYEKFAVQGYEVRAFRYILKNQPRSIYMKQLSDAVHEYYRNTRYVIATADGSTKEEKLPTDDIIYIEVFSHKLLIHAKKGKFFTKGTLSEIETQFADLLFARLDKSSIVNIINIDYIRKNEIILINGETLFASRNHIKNIKQCFMDYSRSRWS